MRSFQKITMIAALAAIAVATGCNKDDEKIPNKITIAGNTSVTLNSSYIPAEAFYYPPVDAQCTGTMYRSEIWIYFTTDAALYIMFYQDTNTEDVPLGTFSVADDACTEGFNAYFYSTPGKKAAGIYFSSGTVTVAKSGNIYDVDIKFTIDPDSGGGTLKGNFTGALPEGQSK